MVSLARHRVACCFSMTLLQERVAGERRHLFHGGGDAAGDAGVRSRVRRSPAGHQHRLPARVVGSQSRPAYHVIMYHLSPLGSRVYGVEWQHHMTHLQTLNSKPVASVMYLALLRGVSRPCMMLWRTGARAGRVGQRGARRGQQHQCRGSRAAYGAHCPRRDTCSLATR